LPLPIPRAACVPVSWAAGAAHSSDRCIALPLNSTARHRLSRCHVFSPQTARESAAAWFLERAYTSYEDMASSEAADKNGIDFVIIATPNDLHYPVARAFLSAGIHVICDKPLALTVAEGEKLARLAEAGTTLFALTHNYTGYPAVRQAREMVRGGQLGEIRKVMVEYTQDWLMEPLENRGNKQAAWRTDPARAGLSGCVGDIGTHAQNLLEFVTDRQIEALCADLSSFVAGRRLDDDASILLRLRGGAKGTLVCSQVACGEENRLSVRVYGSQAGWSGISRIRTHSSISPLAGLGAVADGAELSEPVGQSCDSNAGRASRGLSRGLCEHLPWLHAGRAPSRTGSTADAGLSGDTGWPAWLALHRTSGRQLAGWVGLAELVGSQ